jgi:hypothetical protein
LSFAEHAAAAGPLTGAAAGILGADGHSHNDAYLHIM